MQIILGGKYASIGILICHLHFWSKQIMLVLSWALLETGMIGDWIPSW